MDKDNIAKFKDALTTTIATTNLNCLVISFVAVLLLLIPFKWSYVILLYLFQIVIITIGSYYALTKWNTVTEALKN
ncbi:hypothetical protein IJ096_00110, partial [Candidatus Saccharibacteria bacterium]|nr:hypothetical protein [Candidatus Saccharibacteria bacterium]